MYVFYNFTCRLTNFLESSFLVCQVNFIINIAFDARLDLLGKDCFNMYSNFTGSSLNKRSNLSDVPQNVEVIFENLVMSYRHFGSFLAVCY